MRKIILVFNILYILINVSCNSRDKQNINLNKHNIVVLIRNMTSEPIFVEENFHFQGVDFKGDEKIYYCSVEINAVDISMHIWARFTDIINPNEEKEILIKKFDIDDTKYYYELVLDEKDKDFLAKKIDDGKCEKISFRLFYTKEPIVFQGSEYKYYVNKMKTYGYSAVGYQEGDKLIFNIGGDARVTDTAN